MKDFHMLWVILTCLEDHTLFHMSLSVIQGFVSIYMTWVQTVNYVYNFLLPKYQFHFSLKSGGHVNLHLQ